MSHDRGCPCGKEKYEYEDCRQPNCLKRASRSDEIFGEARENAPPRRHVEPHTPVGVTLPGPPYYLTVTYEQAQRLHHDLGQTLARMMRKRGSATPPDGDIGGTPAAMRVAA